MHSISIILIALISKLNSQVNETIREEIFCGEILSDTAESNGVYIHPFEITENQFVTISSCASDAGYDTMLILYDDEDKRIGWNDDNNLCDINQGTYKSILVSGLLTPGDYYVSITGWNSTSGDYQLKMDCFAQGDDYNSDQDPDCNFVNYKKAFNPLNNSFDTTLFEFGKCYTANYNYYFRIEVSDTINYDSISWKLECNGELNGWKEYVYDGDKCTDDKLVATRDVGPHFFEYNCKGSLDGCDIVTYKCDDISNDIIAGVCSNGVTVQCEYEEDDYVRVYDNNDCSSTEWTAWTATDKSCIDFNEWECDEADSGFKEGVTFVCIMFLINLWMV